MYSIEYNKSMMNKNDKTCHACGRPWNITNECNYCDACPNEYPYKKLACIRHKEPDCEAAAVIPSITVETIDGITNLANCLVHVANINTTFYVDDKHRIMITWAGPVEIDNYDVETNPLKLRSQTLYTYVEGSFTEVYFDRNGAAHLIGTEV